MSDQLETNQAPETELSEKPSKRWLRLGIGALVGGSLGFAYYYFIGCNSGHCPITSNPLISTGYGAVFGMVFTWK